MTKVVENTRIVVLATRFIVALRLTRQLAHDVSIHWSGWIELVVNNGVDETVDEWFSVAPVVITSFMASLVEFVEALTMVLAVGVTRGWRASLGGAATGYQPAPGALIRAGLAARSIVNS